MRGEKHPEFEPGVNPRDVLRHHRERGMTEFSYTYKDLAELFGVSVGRARNMASGGKKRYDPRELESICALWARRGGWTPPSGWGL